MCFRVRSHGSLGVQRRSARDAQEKGAIVFRQRPEMLEEISSELGCGHLVAELVKLWKRLRSLSVVNDPSIIHLGTKSGSFGSLCNQWQPADR